MSRNDMIAISVYGETSIHFKDKTGNWATLCGLDGDDDDAIVQQSLGELPPKSKVNCGHCIALFRYIRTLSAHDIDKDCIRPDSGE